LSLEDLYQEIILDHYAKPRHAGRLDDAQVEVRHFNPVCGDELVLGLRLDGGRVGAIAIQPRGCSISQASASVMTERVLGRPVGEALARGEAFRRLMHKEGEADEAVLGDGVAFEGVARYPVRVKCALLGWMALKDALVRAQAGEPGGETVHGDGDGHGGTAASTAAGPGPPGAGGPGPTGGRAAGAAGMSKEASSGDR
jgi:nitrogen fixation NifU-like protein